MSTLNKLIIIIIILIIIIVWLQSIPKEYSEPCYISKRELYAKIVHAFQTLTISRKSQSLLFEFDKVPNTSLKYTDVVITPKSNMIDTKLETKSYRKLQDKNFDSMDTI